MRRKVTDTLILIAAAGGCLGLTLAVAHGNYRSSTMVYNLAFWGVIAALYMGALIFGLFRMSRMKDYLEQSAEKIDGVREEGHLSSHHKIQMLMGEGLFDRKLEAFLYDLHHSQSGICDIEDYINEEETDRMMRRKVLDLIPDIMTSLGILGTFVGLVWGLREFEPSNYETMTASVTSLVDGIKVAFLTSIYGLSMSLTFSYSMKTGYLALTDSLKQFLDAFHTSVVPASETEVQNLVVNRQKEQVELLRGMVSEFSDQVAAGYAGALAPTLEQINTSLGGMMATITRNQQMFLQDIVDSFVREMHKSFQSEFDGFGKQLEEMNQAMSRNVTFTEKLYQNMCTEMSSLFAKEEKNMHTAVAELSAIQKKYADAMDRLSAQYRQVMESYGKAQDSTLKNLSIAEQESSRFWVACNQAMQNYLQEAAAAYHQFEKSNTSNEQMLTAMTAIYQKNEQMMEDFRDQLQAHAKMQTEFAQVTGSFTEMLAKVQAAGSDQRSIYLGYSDAGQNGTKLQEAAAKILKDSAARQEAMLEESVQAQEELLREMKDMIRKISENTGKKRTGFWS